MLLYWCSEGDADLVQSWWVDEDGARDWSAVPLGAEVVWSSVPRRWSQPSVGCTESRSHVGHGRATEVARRWSTQSAEATCRVWSVCFWKILLTLLPRLVGSLSEKNVDTFAAFGLLFCHGSHVICTWCLQLLLVRYAINYRTVDASYGDRLKNLNLLLLKNRWYLGDRIQLFKRTKRIHDLTFWFHWNIRRLNEYKG